MRDELGFRWLGVAGIELIADDQVLVVDPYVTRVPFWRLWFGRVQPDADLARVHVPRCQHLLVTHAHFDHLLDAPAVASYTGCRIYGSPNTCRLVAMLGVPAGQIVTLHQGEHLELGPFGVDVLSSEHRRAPGFGPGPISANLHPPLRARDLRMDEAYAFRIQAAGYSVLTDPGVHPGTLPPSDVLLVNPFGTAPYYQRLLAQVGPQLIIPCHWDDFWRPLTRPLRPILMPPLWAIPPTRWMDMARFQQMIGQIAPHRRVFVPQVLRAYDLAALLVR
jgi:L-ascorbate metabolism protein UlaG (beta-lactamase superfamily)